MTWPVKKLGLFGGTFNPIHNGHLKVALEVRDRLSLDKVLFIPSYLPPHKPSRDVASPADRLRMVELAIASLPGLEASSLEVERAEPSYSIVTLERVKKMYNLAQIFFIIGIDAFLEIKTWKDYQRVLKACLFVVVSRPGFVLEQAVSVLGPEWRGKIVTIEDKDYRLENLREGVSIILFPLPALDISSSLIRTRLHQGKSIAGLVPEAVEKYIFQNHLYSDQP